MRKIFLIGWKDLTLAFRDPAALVLMLAAPFALTLGMGLVTGAFNSSSGGALERIPVAIVNQDEGPLGQALVDVFSSDELADLFNATVTDDEAAARAAVDADKSAALVLVPAGFSSGVIPSDGAPPSADAPQIEIYSNPARQISAGVAQAVVEQFIGRIETARIAGQVTVEALIASGRLDPAQAAQAGAQYGAQQAEAQGEPAIRVQSAASGQPPTEFNILAYMAPGMALLFLMYTVTYGGRSLLVERAQGTLPRLLVSPTSNAQVLGGKVAGIFLTGLAQMGILIGASSMFFQIKWGDPLGLIALIAAAVLGATGWGLVIAALTRTPGQAASIGSAVMLTFGILGGSFFDMSNAPLALRWISRITPNAWGMDGFTTLALGGGLADLGGTLLGLLAMSVLLFGVALLLFNRRGLAQK